MAGTQQVTVRDRALELVDSLGEDLAQALPQGLKADRFRAAFLGLAVHNPDIFRCDEASLRSALLKCASDGLVPDARHAVILPFRTTVEVDGKKTSVTLAQYIPMVQGIIARSRELGETLSITANVVHKNDRFEFDDSDPSMTVHKRPELSLPRGDMVGAYAIFRDMQGRVMHREVMDIAQLEKTHNVSKAKDSPAWRNWTSEMYRKTVIRRGSKYIAMSEALRRIVEREDEYVAFDQVDDAPALPANFNPLKDRRPAAIAHQPAETVAIDTGASRNAPSATVDRSTAETSASAGGAGAAKADRVDPEGGIPGRNDPKPAAVLNDAQRSRLRAYNEVLADVLISTELGNASSTFWGSAFPDEGTLIYGRVMIIFDAHMERAKGQSSPAAVDEALAKALA